MNKHLFAALSFIYFFSATAIAENSTNAAEGFSYDYIDTSIVRYNLESITQSVTALMFYLIIYIITMMSPMLL